MIFCGKAQKHVFVFLSYFMKKATPCPAVQSAISLPFTVMLTNLWSCHECPTFRMEIDMAS